MRSTNLYFFLAISLALFSCNKDKTQCGPDCIPWEGNFLCDVESNRYYNGTISHNFDEVVSCVVENNVLKVGNYSFPISSDDQTEFRVDSEFSSG